MMPDDMQTLRNLLSTTSADELQRFATDLAWQTGNSQISRSDRHNYANEFVQFVRNTIDMTGGDIDSILPPPVTQRACESMLADGHFRNLGELRNELVASHNAHHVPDSVAQDAKVTSLASRLELLHPVHLRRVTATIE